MLTVSSVITTDLVPLRDRGYYQGMYGIHNGRCDLIPGIMMTIFGLGSMAGGPLSGLIADSIGWQYAFWIQVPIAALCIVIVAAFLPQAPIGPTHPSLRAGLAALDWTGTVLLVGGVTTLILGFSFHTSFILPWSSPVVWGNLLASVVALGAFYVVEKRVKNPLVPLSLLKSKHRLAIFGSGFFLSIGNQAFVSFRESRM